MPVPNASLHQFLPRDDILPNTLFSYHAKWKEHWYAYIPDFTGINEYDINLSIIMTCYWTFKALRSERIQHSNILNTPVHIFKVTNIDRIQGSATLPINFIHLILSFFTVSPLQFNPSRPVSPWLQILYHILSLTFINS